jgi:hypothetical protein
MPIYMRKSILWVPAVSFLNMIVGLLPVVLIVGVVFVIVASFTKLVALPIVSVAMPVELMKRVALVPPFKFKVVASNTLTAFATTSPATVSSVLLEGVVVPMRT